MPVAAEVLVDVAVPVVVGDAVVASPVPVAEVVLAASLGVVGVPLGGGGEVEFLAV